MLRRVSTRERSPAVWHGVRMLRWRPSLDIPPPLHPPTERPGRMTTYEQAKDTLLALAEATKGFDGNEATTRLRLIDIVIKDVLGWPPGGNCM